MQTYSKARQRCLIEQKMPHISFYQRKEPHGSAFQTKALLHDKMINEFDIARFRVSKKRIIHENVTIDHNL